MAEAPKKPLVLCVDDEPDVLRPLTRILSSEGFDVESADNGFNALDVLTRRKPDVILLDVLMPGMDGYAFCSKLQESEEYAYIPVIFLTALQTEQDKAKAFAVGATDYLVKPFEKEHLVRKIREQLKTGERWEGLKEEKPDPPPLQRKISATDFIKFRQYLVEQIEPEEKIRQKIEKSVPETIYSLADHLQLTGYQMARHVADFMGLPFTSFIDPETIQLGVLPTLFCKSNCVVAVNQGHEQIGFVLSNPFNLELLDLLRKVRQDTEVADLVLAAPDTIKSLLQYGSSQPRPTTEEGAEEGRGDYASKVTAEPSEEEYESHPVVTATYQMLVAAVTERASDIHVEPKDQNTLVRFRIDGDMRDILRVEKKMGRMIISRLKVLSGLDIAERRKPQDGACETWIANRAFLLRVATTSTPNGEAAIIRLLEPYAKARDLENLGMTGKQTKSLVDLGNRTQGMILVVGPTGSGKTTTIYSLLSSINCKTRSLMSVEDPVEYRIPFANQQQVNEKAGVSFESLLKSSVRQDPDILFLGEIRDPYSAKVAVDFASTGHLTITSLHTTNATTAVFRLERLGLLRGTLADTLLGVIAQRLLKKLCPECKEIVPITDEEAEILEGYMDELPQDVARPKGCGKCNNTGYFGREGVYEVIRFDPAISEMVRDNSPVSEIRKFVRQRGNYLISHHAAEKVKDQIFSVQEAYERVVVEEAAFGEKRKKTAVSVPEMPPEEESKKKGKPPPSS